MSPRCDEAHMAQATSTKWAIMRLGLACAPEYLSRSSQPDLGIFSARREPGAHSDSELGPRWGRDSEPAPVVDVTRRRSAASRPQARRLWRAGIRVTGMMPPGQRDIGPGGGGPGPRPHQRRAPLAATFTDAGSERQPHCRLPSHDGSPWKPRGPRQAKLKEDPQWNPGRHLAAVLQGQRLTEGRWRGARGRGRRRSLR
jgi:hypothetical protein